MTIISEDGLRRVYYPENPVVGVSSLSTEIKVDDHRNDGIYIISLIINGLKIAETIAGSFFNKNEKDIIAKYQTVINEIYNSIDIGSHERIVILVYNDGEMEFFQIETLESISDVVDEFKRDKKIEELAENDNN